MLMFSFFPAMLPSSLRLWKYCLVWFWFGQTHALNKLWCPGSISLLPDSGSKSWQISNFFCSGPYVHTYMTWFVQDNNHQSLLSWKFFGFSHGNKWRGNFACVQPHNYIQANRTSLQEARVVPGNWQQMPDRRYYYLQKRDSFSYCAIGKFCVTFIFYNHFYMKGA